MDARRQRPRRRYDRLEWRRNNALMDDYDDGPPHMHDIEDIFVDFLDPAMNHPGFGRPENVLARPRGALLAPSRRRNMVVVTLSNEFGGTRPVNQGRYSVDRELLFTYLPRSQHSVRRGILNLDHLVTPPELEECPEYLIRSAIRFIFSHLERLSRTGNMDMFGAAEQQMEDELDRPGIVREWASTMHAVCTVLSNDGSLGCSHELLGHIMGFLEIIFQDVQNLMGWWETSVLFQAFADIFRATRRDLVEQLHRIWARFDPEVQDELLRSMRLAMPAEGFEGSAQRMIRALRP
ncbi:hypothetical protein QQX98_006101 [Neonectria punicea]|uniref:Uncharacterized protein n=1 Tax=Neonectria punicea TaxID=979145 RepID=A0ABR1H2N8_9HYPO